MQAVGRTTPVVYGQIDKWSIHNLDHIVALLATIPIGYDNTVHPKVITDIWEGSLEIVYKPAD